MRQETPNVDASVITEPLDSLLTALANKIEREWPRDLAGVWGAQPLFLLTLRTADVTYRSIRWLCADSPPNPNRRTEYCLSVPPLNRTILDNLFTVIFILEDLRTRCEWFHKAAWREERIELDRYRLEYGHLPNWQAWLDQLAAHSNLGVTLLGLSAEEVAQPSAMIRWPNAGVMVTYRLSPSTPMPPVRAFMKYLNDWFYADLSQQAHLGGTGLMKRAVPLLFERGSPERERALTKNKYAWLGQTMALIIALASELEAYFHFGLRERANYLWGLMAPLIVVAQEMYDKRYAELLGAQRL